MSAILEVSLEKLVFDGTDIILEDLGNGQGKIIVAGYLNGSTYWGSMGEPLKDFIKGINNGYFANRLCSNNSVFSEKKTKTAVRKALKEILPWYREVEWQKGFREWLNDVEFSSNDSFVHKMEKWQDSSNYDSRMWYDLDIQAAFSEPWHLIQTEPSPEYKWYCRLHDFLKKNL